MTDPIAVDAPVKPAYSRSVPLGLPSPSLAPTPELRVDPPKPATTITTAAATVAAAALGVPPVPVATAAPATKGFLARFTKRQLVIGATAAVSLFAGVGAVRMMFPAKDAATPVAASGEKVTLNTPTTTPEKAPPKPPAVEVVPPPNLDPLMPPPPAASGTTARPTGIQPITPPPPGAAPPTIHSEQPRYGATSSPSPLPVPTLDITPPSGVRFASGSELPKNPPAAPVPVATPDARTTPSALPPLPNPDLSFPPSGLLPAGGSDLPKPPPATPPLPALPALPTTPGAGAAIPPKVEPGAPKLPDPNGGAPKLPDPAGFIPPVVPKTPDPAFPAPGGLIPLPKTIDTAPPAGAPKLPDPGGVVPVTPKTPDPAFPAPTGITPLPKTADPAPTVTPDLFPAPKIEVKPAPQPEFKPPAIDPPGGVGTSTNFVKPVGEVDAKPAAPAFAPKTTFDVDIHNPGATDTYETISQEFYNDKRFAAALKAYNQNQPLEGGRYVNVPPIHVLKRQFPNLGGAAAPVGGTGAAEWGAAPVRPAAGARNSFVVPQGGMTLQEIARHTLGNQQRWQDIYELNRQFTDTAAVIPAGTELKLPPDARVP